VKRSLWIVLLALAVAACGPSEDPQQKAAARLAKAEAAMQACKDQNGLGTTPTPTTVVLDDPATRGQAPTPDMANQIRLKVACRIELDELLDARRGAGPGK
jgi:hypothetical protein